MNRFSRVFEDDPAAFGEMLLRRARDDRPSPQSRERILAHVAAAGVAATGAGLLAASVAEQGATVSTAKVGALVVTKWALAGAVAATAVLGVREAVVNDGAAQSSSAARSAGKPILAPHPTRAPAGRAEQPSSVPSVAPSTEDFVAPSRTSAAPVAQDPVPSPQDVPSRSPAPASREGREGKEIRNEPANAGPVELAPAPVDTGVPAAAPRSDVPARLARELEFLEKARARLAQQSPIAALDALNDYERSFPSGIMNVEASALRVEALAEAGRSDDAMRLGRAFLAAYPRNPMADRVRTFLSRLEATPYKP